MLDRLLPALHRRIRQDDGAGLAEYALLLLFVASVVALVLPNLAAGVEAAINTAIAAFP